MNRRVARVAPHLDDDTVGPVPEAMVVQAPEHAAGFDGQDEAGMGAEIELFDRARDRTAAAAEPRAVDLDLVPGCGIAVDHEEAARHRSAM